MRYATIDNGTATADANLCVRFPIKGAGHHSNAFICWSMTRNHGPALTTAALVWNPAINYLGPTITLSLLVLGCECRHVHRLDLQSLSLKEITLWYLWLNAVVRQKSIHLCPYRLSSIYEVRTDEEIRAAIVQMIAFPPLHPPNTYTQMQIVPIVPFLKCRIKSTRLTFLSFKIVSMSCSEKKKQLANTCFHMKSVKWKMKTHKNWKKSDLLHVKEIYQTTDGAHF